MEGVEEFYNGTKSNWIREHASPTRCRASKAPLRNCETVLAKNELNSTAI
jgi:hypothetical protein